MHPLQLLSDTVAWTGKNIAYNLGKIPDDKLTYKPAPDAKSPLEIASEVAGVLGAFTAMLQKQTPGEGPVFTTLEAAQQGVEKASDDYAQLLLSMGDNDMTGDMTLPFGAIPKSRAICLPVVDTVHHHGQLAYIQTMLGDTQTHFWDMGS